MRRFILVTLVMLLGGLSAMAGCDAEPVVTPPIGQIFVDETGFLEPDLVHYSSESSLNLATGKLVMVMGLPGALKVPSGVLTSRNKTNGSGAVYALSSADGSFLVAVSATKDDVVELAYVSNNVTGIATVTLSDPLDTQPGLVVTPGSTGEPATLSVTLGSSGQVSVGLEQFTNRTTPLVVYNSTNGASVFAALTSTSAEIAGAAGDTVCVFPLGGTGAGVQICANAE